MSVTPHLPPVSPNEVQPDAYELMRKALESGEVADFASEGGERAQRTRDDLSGALKVDADLEYAALGHEDPKNPNRTPVENTAMEDWRRTPVTPIVQ